MQIIWNWSRRIDNRHRLVYIVRKGHLEILSCKGHYDVGQAAGYGPSPTRCNCAHFITHSDLIRITSSI